MHAVCPWCTSLPQWNSPTPSLPTHCLLGACTSECHWLPYTQVNKCLSIKGAEDTINKPYAFEISTHTESMFFIADSEKVCCCRDCCVLVCSALSLSTLSIILS